MSIPSTPRHAWVDIAKAISITLVVMMHATLGVGEATGQVGFMHYVLAFASPFRMPEFFVISGLFLGAVIARPWRLFADRRIVHYLYFYLLWAAIQIAFKHALVERDPLEALRLFTLSFIEPYSVLWFIYALAVFSLITRIVWQLKLPNLAVFALAAIASILPVETPVPIANYTAAYFVYFFAGYAFAPRILAFARQAAARPLITLAALALWAALNTVLVFGPGHEIAPAAMMTGADAIPGLRFVLALLGAAAICAIAALLARLPATGWLGWVGAHSLVIYLSFVLPMGIFRTILLALVPGIDTGLASLLVLIVAVTAPLAVYWLIGRIGFGHFLFERPSWAHIPGTQRPAGTPLASRTDR